MQWQKVRDFKALADDGTEYTIVEYTQATDVSNQLTGPGLAFGGLPKLETSTGLIVVQTFEGEYRVETASGPVVVRT